MLFNFLTTYIGNWPVFVYIIAFVWSCILAYMYGMASFFVFPLLMLAAVFADKEVKRMYKDKKEK